MELRRQGLAEVAVLVLIQVVREVLVVLVAVALVLL
jgi:hypothetical protein